MCVKAYYEPGFDPRVGTLPVPTAELMREVRDSTHRRKLPLVVHANSLDAHRFAVQAGANAVVHGSWNWGRWSRLLSWLSSWFPRGERLPGPVREVLDAELRNGVAYMPTSRVLSGLADLRWATQSTMNMPLFPSIDGTAAIRAPARAFVNAFGRRIEAGLLSGTSGRRCRYVVTETASDALQFRAIDWPTAANVGLNDVKMTVSASGVVQYHVRYMRWAAYALALSGGIGLLFIVFLLTFDLRGYIASHPGPEYLGLSADQNVAIAWGMALFWGFAWPWILIALHKRPLRRLMEQLFAEVDATAVEP